MGADWRAMVKARRGFGRWGRVVDRDVELRGFKGVLTVHLYSIKTHSHPTAYVYSKRLT